jgi:hypothetical protein
MLINILIAILLSLTGQQADTTPELVEPAVEQIIVVNVTVETEIGWERHWPQVFFDDISTPLMYPGEINGELNGKLYGNRWISADNIYKQVFDEITPNGYFEIEALPEELNKPITYTTQENRNTTVKVSIYTVTK